MRRSHSCLAAAVASLALLWSAAAAAADIEVLWLGQAATRITTQTGKVIVIDPFLKKNPKTPAEYKDLGALGKVDVILLTHAHFDHTADAGELAKLTGAKVVGNAELPRAMAAYGMIAEDAVVAMNKGGTVMPLGPEIRIHMVPADHSSGLAVTNPITNKPDTVYAGAPVGYVIELENGFTIYHAGDTNVFGDMALINALFAPDLALVPIGGHFTMGPSGAAFAIRELIQPKEVLPIHYGTFPPLKGTPAELIEALGTTPVKVHAINPGKPLTF